MTWLAVVALAGVSARFSSDWTRYVDVAVAMIALLAWGRRELRL